MISFLPSLPPASTKSPLPLSAVLLLTAVCAPTAQTAFADSSLSSRGALCRQSLVRDGNAHRRCKRQTHCRRNQQKMREPHCNHLYITTCIKVYNDRLTDRTHHATVDAHGGTSRRRSQRAAKISNQISDFLRLGQSLDQRAGTSHLDKLTLKLSL